MKKLFSFILALMILFSATSPVEAATGSFTLKCPSEDWYNYGQELQSLYTKPAHAAFFYCHDVKIKHLGTPGDVLSVLSGSADIAIFHPDYLDPLFDEFRVLVTDEPVTFEYKSVKANSQELIDYIYFATLGWVVSESSLEDYDKLRKLRDYYIKEKQGINFDKFLKGDMKIILLIIILE